MSGCLYGVESKQRKSPDGIASSQYMYSIGRLLYNLIWWNNVLLLSIFENASSMMTEQEINTMFVNM